MGKKSKPRTISSSRLAKINAEIRETGEPVLGGSTEDYETIIIAQSSEDGFELTLPLESWEAPFTIWREYAEYKDLTIEEVMAERGFEDEDELDEEIELSDIEQFVDDEDAPGAMLWNMLEEYAECVIEVDGARVPMTLVHKFDEGRPSWSQISLTSESPVRLSLLQHVLNAGKSGIGIELFD